MLDENKMNPTKVEDFDPEERHQFALNLEGKMQRRTLLEMARQFGIPNYENKTRTQLCLHVLPFVAEEERDHIQRSLCQELLLTDVAMDFGIENVEQLSEFQICTKIIDKIDNPVIQRFLIPLCQQSWNRLNRFSDRRRNRRQRDLLDLEVEAQNLAEHFPRRRRRVKQATSGTRPWVTMVQGRESYMRRMLEPHMLPSKRAKAPKRRRGISSRELSGIGLTREAHEIKKNKTRRNEMEEEIQSNRELLWEEKQKKRRQALDVATSEQMVLDGLKQQMVLDGLKQSLLRGETTLRNLKPKISKKMYKELKAWEK